MSTIDTRATFGVSFHPKMSTRKVTKLWFNDVTQEVRDKYPELNEAMELCRSHDLALDTSQITKELELEAQKLLDEALAIASSIVNGILAYPTQVLKAVQAIADLKININTTTSCKTKLHQKIDDILPEYIED